MTPASKRLLYPIALCIASLALGLCPLSVRAQNSPYERAFPQSKSTVEKALQQIQSSLSGRLPVLEGFAAPAGHPLASYRRGFYQINAQVISAPSGQTVVRLTTKVTAWYSDPSGAHSGYQLLPSNGRIEGDLLDQLADQFSGPLTSQAPAAASNATQEPRSEPPAETSSQASTVTRPSRAASNPSPSTAPPANQTASSSEPAISAPTPRIPDTSGTFSSSLSEGLAANAKGKSQPGTALGENFTALQNEATNLEQVLKSQAHPKNLVAVKKTGTPVVSSPSLTAKTLFLASAHDEFEMLNFNRDWVHVRISGLSRGWIWRDSLELPNSVPDGDAAPAPALSPAAELFHVSREETAPFPGDWEPLRGKNVKIVSVEKVDDSAKDDGTKADSTKTDAAQDESAELKLAFTKSLLNQNYGELAKKSDSLAGIVVIFDSADGGMMAATFSTLQQWKAGQLSDAALWHQCFFDPPETFVPSVAPASK